MSLLKELASALAVETVNTFQDRENQTMFLGVDSKTDQTTVVLVCIGDAAEAVLQYLDAMKEDGKGRFVCKTKREL